MKATLCCFASPFLLRPRRRWPLPPFSTRRRPRRACWPPRAPPATSLVAPQASTCRVHYPERSTARCRGARAAPPGNQARRKHMIPELQDTLLVERDDDMPLNKHSLLVAVLARRLSGRQIFLHVFPSMPTSRPSAYPVTWHFLGAPGRSYADDKAIVIP